MRRTPLKTHLRPSPRLAFLVLLGILPLALLPIAPWVLGAVLAYDLLLALGAALEAARMPRALGVRRSVPGIAYQGEPLREAVEIRGEGAGTVRLSIREEAGDGFAPIATRAHIASGGIALHEVVPLLPIARGTRTLGPVEIEWTGPWGLVRREGRFEARAEVRVLPGRDLAIRALGRRGVTPAGSILALRANEGHEFDAFRPYVLGDDFRRIDWKASARRGALHLRTYRPERGQIVVCVLDTGRGGALPVADMGGAAQATLLDRAAAAAAALAGASRAEGDRIGILAYDAVVRAWLPPGRGAEHHGAALALLSDLASERAEGDPNVALASLERRLSRRALVLVFSEAGDPESAAPLLEAMRRLVPKHLPVLVTITDPALERAAAAPPRDEVVAIRRLAALDLLEERRKVFARLRAAGCEAIAVRSDRLARAAVGAYLDLKSRGRI